MRNWFRGLKLNQKFTVTTLIFIFIPLFGMMCFGFRSIKKNAIDHGVNEAVTAIDLTCATWLLQRKTMQRQVCSNGSSTNRSRKKRAPRQSSTRSSSFQEIRWVYSCSTRSWRLALIRRQRPWPARSNRIHPQEKRIAENSAILFFMKPPVCIKNEIYN